MSAKKRLAASAVLAGAIAVGSIVTQGLVSPTGNARAAPSCVKPAISQMWMDTPTVGRAVSFHVRWTGGEDANIRTQFNGVYVAFDIFFLQIDKANSTYYSKIVVDDETYQTGESFRLGFEITSGCGDARQEVSWQPGQQAKPAPCPDIQVIDAHGSGASAYELSPPGARFVYALYGLLPSKTIEVDPVPFAAAGGPFTLVEGLLKLPFGYHPSLVRMKYWLRHELDDVATNCPGTQVFLVGYSQGAQAVGDVYQQKAWKQVEGVALFGDPKYNHVDNSDRFGLNVSPRKRQTGLNGVLGTRPAFHGGKVMSFCHKHDPVCQGPLDYSELVRYRFKQHDNYTSFGEPELAAKTLTK